MTSSEPISDLSSHLGYWLRFVSNHVSQAFARKLEERQVTVAEWVMMRELYEAEGMAPSDLAARLGMTRGAITRLADRLIGKRFLTRAADPRDGRSQILALTRQGRVLVPDLAALADRNDAEFFHHLSEREHASLMRILKEIVERRALKTIPLD